MLASAQKLQRSFLQKSVHDRPKTRFDERIAGTCQQSSLKAGWNRRQAAVRLEPWTQRKNVSSLNPIDCGKP